MRNTKPFFTLLLLLIPYFIYSQNFNEDSIKNDFENMDFILLGEDHYSDNIGVLKKFLLSQKNDVLFVYELPIYMDLNIFKDSIQVNSFLNGWSPKIRQLFDFMMSDSVKGKMKCIPNGTVDKLSYKYNKKLIMKFIQYNYHEYTPNQKKLADILIKKEMSYHKINRFIARHQREISEDTNSLYFLLNGIYYSKKYPISRRRDMLMAQMFNYNLSKQNVDFKVIGFFGSGHCKTKLLNMFPNDTFPSMAYFLKYKYHYPVKTFLLEGKNEYCIYSSFRETKKKLQYTIEPNISYYTDFYINNVYKVLIPSDGVILW